MSDANFARCRSWLFTPATRPDRFAKAAAASVDVAILDLEDSVAPADKDHARNTALNFLLGRKPDGIRHALRINGLDTHAGLRDLNALIESSAAPDYLVLPKTDAAGHLQVLDRLLTVASRGTRLVGIVESARGLAALDAIASATPRLAGLMLGAADMAADLGAATAWEPLAFVRADWSRLAPWRAWPQSMPRISINDTDGLQEEMGRAVAFGFQAKAAIHPGQVAAINAALTPTPEAIEKARAVLAENAKGVGTVGGQMIDEAVARKARRTLVAAAGPSRKYPPH
jgi:(S)-citramalyl-CoA lyase